MAHILIVDDSPTEVMMLSDIVRKGGHRVSTASTAAEGITLARDQRPDLILMDIVMPEMNGFQATRSLSRDPLTAEIPVIIVTNKTMETDRAWGMRQGARDFVVKPVRERDLLDRIGSLLTGGGAAA